MRTEKIKVAVYDLTLSNDSFLLNRLNENFDISICKDVILIRDILEEKRFNVLLLEIGTNGKELKILKEIQDQYPKLHVITLGLEKPQQHLINAFKYGSNDFFKMPINVDLLIERIEGLVRKNNLLKNYL